ncbi:MAG: hypothetical protein UHS49_05110 [Faecalimonas sp.]|nr:hypothetical protein [Faecalimonas sp.]
MRNQVLKHLKRMMTVALAVSTIAVCAFGSVVLAVDETTTADDVVKYVEVTNCDEVPTYPSTSEYGYLFGGWYTSSETNKYTPVTDTSSVEGQVYAKFVPAYIMSVKFQNQKGVNESSTETAVRLVTGVDSLNYMKVGFEISVVTLGDDGCLQSVSTEVIDSSSMAYEKFNVYEDENDTTGTLKSADDVFGTGAEYFAAGGIKKVVSGKFGATICVRPYWLTPDGTKVRGLTKYAHVEDGYVHGEGTDAFRYVNIPINLRATQPQSAVGILSVTAPSGFTYSGFEVEGGKFFEEMAWNANSEATIKLVGNLETVPEVGKTADQIYANIRYKIAADADVTGGKFTIGDIDFCNGSETLLTDYEVWNVKY